MLKPNNFLFDASLFTSMGLFFLITNSPTSPQPPPPPSNIQFLRIALGCYSLITFLRLVPVKHVINKTITVINKDVTTERVQRAEALVTYLGGQNSETRLQKQVLLFTALRLVTLKPC